MDTREIKELLISAIVLALAFGIAISGGISNILNFGMLFTYVLIALFAISLGFILHELGHRFLARRFGCYAEYRMWRQGLMFALLFSLFGFVIAAPGAVTIHPRADLWGNTAPLTRNKIGLISLSGPVMNIFLAVIFLILNIFYPLSIFRIGAYVNTWLAFFNSIPIPPLDGFKIFAWDRRVWITLFIIAVALLFLSF